MRHVDQNVLNQRQRMKMAEEIGNDVDAVSDAEEPKIEASGLCGNQRSEERELACAEVTEINEFAHVEQTEHEAVLIHNAGNVIERIHTEKKQRKAESALLDDRKFLSHRPPMGPLSCCTASIVRR